MVFFHSLAWKKYNLITQNVGEDVREEKLKNHWLGSKCLQSLWKPRIT